MAHCVVACERVWLLMIRAYEVCIYVNIRYR